MTRYARRYRRIARKLSRLDLMAGSMDDAFALAEGDLLDGDADRRFLDFYGEKGLRMALERYGIWEAVERRGYEELSLSTRADDDRHTLIVSGRPPGAESTHLIELVVRRDRLVPRDAPERERLAEGYDVLTVDWLALRNPLADFTPARPRLPGQDAPGLGIGERVVETLYRVVDRLGLAGMMTVAEHFHNAVLYRREIEFFDPVYAGRCGALERLLLKREGLSLAQASWAVAWGLVCEGEAPYAWRGEAQVWAADSTLKEWLGSAEYGAREREALEACDFRLDRPAFDARWADEAPALEGREPPPAGTIGPND